MNNPYPQSDVIKSIRWLTEPSIYPGSHGDLWACTWARDGNVYAAADDTLGINYSNSSNLAVYKIEGNPPHHKISLVNPMRAYGPMCWRDGQDTWKANGLTSVDGVLYMSVSQHSSAGDYPDCVQRTYNASIIRSEDYGQTWSPKLQEPMFPGMRFSTPFFVQYGQDNQGAMDDFAYAVSSSGTWNNGNYMVMGRCKRANLYMLSAADWEFYRGLDAAGNPQWTPKVEFAQGIFKFRGFTSMTGIQYVPAIERFTLAQWAYEDLDQPQPWQLTMLHMYEAPKPWGPWKHFHTQRDWGKGRGFYNPCICSKWFEEGGKRMWMMAAGDFCLHDQKDPRFVYGCVTQKLELAM